MKSSKKISRLTALPLLCLSVACSTNKPVDPCDYLPCGGECPPCKDPCDNPPCEPPPPPPPGENVNVLYIMTDQQSYYMISEICRNLAEDNPYRVMYRDHQWLNTPNLDKLVKRGYSFTKAYCAHAVSVPSRFALLTGESPNQYGQWGNTTSSTEPGRTQMRTVIEQRSMGQLFKKAGYNTYYGGKMHLPMASTKSAAVDSDDAINDGPTRYGFVKENFLTWNDREELAEKGAAFFSTYEEEKPFLLFLSFMNPHDICMTNVLWETKTLAEYLAGIDGGENSMEGRARVNQVYFRGIYNQISSTEWNTDELGKLPPNDEPTPDYPIKNASEVHGVYNSIQKNRAHIWFYYKLVEQVDAQIGQVLDALDNSRFKDNTVIIFTSDHGEMGLSHNTTAKNLPYEECQRVPLIFAGNGIQEGVIDLDTPVSSGFDMLPTMLDLMGLDIPAELHGVSLLNKITNGEEINRKYIYMETVNTYGVLEDGRYKYTRFVTRSPYTLNAGQTDSLFDLEKDPGEMTNLVHDPSCDAKKAQLKAALQAELTVRGINTTI